MNKNNDIICDNLIVLAAFRYTLGRMTYMVGHVTDWLIEIWHKLPPRDQELIAKEIEAYNEKNKLGMDCDRTDWLRVLAHHKNILSEKNDSV